MAKHMDTSQLWWKTKKQKTGCTVNKFSRTWFIEIHFETVLLILCFSPMSLFLKIADSAHIPTMQFKEEKEDKSAPLIWSQGYFLVWGCQGLIFFSRRCKNSEMVWFLLLRSCRKKGWSWMLLHWVCHRSTRNTVSLSFFGGCDNRSGIFSFPGELIWAVSVRLLRKWPAGVMRFRFLAAILPPSVIQSSLDTNQLRWEGKCIHSLYTV